MSDLLLNPKTSAAIESFINKPSHSLIIDGKLGTGKRSIANFIASKLLNISPEQLSTYSNILNIEPDNSSISIEKIRLAQQFLKLRTTGDSPVRRILIVDQAEQMTIEAQNAFLKILEEPPADTVILIITNQKIKLLPTIRSRAQTLTVQNLSKNQINEYFINQGFGQEDINKAYNITNGRIGIMSTLLNNGADGDHFESIDQAKQILAMSKFERLTLVDQLAKNKEALPALLNSLSLISAAALKQTLGNDRVQQAKQWHQKLKLAIKTEQEITLNPNTKLLLTDLFLSL